MDATIRRLNGANMDIDLASLQGQIAWQQDKCPWNEAEHTDEHKCATSKIAAYTAAAYRSMLTEPNGLGSVDHAQPDAGQRHRHGQHRHQSGGAGARRAAPTF
jgi:hypothetical protein